MISLYALVSLALLSLTTAQSDPALGIEAIEAHFKQAGITPGLFTVFNPIAVLDLTYDGVTGPIPVGKPLTKDQVAPTPKLTITGANSSLAFTDTYTICMVDAGPVGTDDSKGVTRHWLVNSVHITDKKAVGTDGTAITQYAGPAPPAGSGPHRYVVLIYAQPPNFVAPAELSQPNTPVAVFDLAKYSSNLGPIIAATYITVEEGTASVSLSATSAVVSSTLPPVTSSSTGGSGSGTSTSGQPKPSTGGSLGSKDSMFPFIMLLIPFALMLA
jgi:hypothetical protein